ncbi:hypothetical protein HGRIS_003982 [Hohenbuehelia grisea]|uniref:Glucose-methanol-choline oxidoreductase N-terminal domain-containing protein n=1 Tax=Hohenbuehelia grisea TaxID=104357 RepID=A0ABR3JH38_9AGAR
MNFESTFDIIFAGGGATACVTAGRLAAWQPTLKILIIEAGKHTQDIKEHVQPGRFFENLLPGHHVYTFHPAQPSEHVRGRFLSVRTGKCLGGGSGINFMIYTRAAASDYDNWEEEYDNPGWGSKHMLPLLNKAETYEVTGGNPEVHGHSGPVHVSYGGIYTNTGRDFLETALQFDKTRKMTHDVNGFHECDAYGVRS